MARALDFHDETALLDRLSTGVSRRPQKVIFLVGAPLSSPQTEGGPGVPDVNGMIELIRSEFSQDPTERSALERELGQAGSRVYQAAFSFLQGRRGQQTANEIVCRAVLAALAPRTLAPTVDFNDHLAAEATCRSLQADISRWHLNPGTGAIGGLVSHFPDTFGDTLLTTNFDPLLEIAIQKTGGHHYRTVLHSDGNLGQTEATGCHVVHFHGFWLGTDTLHTARQLGQPRPHLKDSLRSLLRNKLVVACAYGGWDDAFTQALMEVVRDVNAYPEIIWTFYRGHPDPPGDLIQQLDPGIDRGRVNLYSGIDCNSFLPKLYDRWVSTKPRASAPSQLQSNPVHVSRSLAEEIHDRPTKHVVIEGDDEDRPPVVDILVGREKELALMTDSRAKVILLTGIGGQGKSSIAARYFSYCQEKRRYTYYVWRDCKEESERFENQLTSVVEQLSGGKISGGDLSKQSSSVIIEILLRLLRNQNVLFVFDNADHHVDLTRATMTGAADRFIRSLTGSSSQSQSVFTCRPEVTYDATESLNIHLEGISLNAAAELFSKRGARSSVAEIEEAYHLTNGHAFWLDLLAIQVGKQHAPADLATLVAEIGSGSELEEKTLTSIWARLRDREQIVLRAMAESVRPSTEAEIAEYVADEMNHNKAIRSLRNLRTQNLIVIKERQQGPDLVELHPLLRRFIKKNFTETERLGFIERIIRVYRRFTGINKKQLSYRPSLSILQNWTQSCELLVAARRIEGAFAVLAEVSQSFSGSGYPREFVRVARELFRSVDWVAEHEKLKGFEDVFQTYVTILEDTGQLDQVDALLGEYELTVPNRDARYIHYCDMRCYSRWFRGDFGMAVKWGRVGVELKTSSGVDTKYDASHNLALAERDAGRPEAALPRFLYGKNLSEVIDPGTVGDARSGEYYGNIGRCLHLMGQADEALVCYQKSALLLEKAQVEHFVNQGFIRTWVAELLLSRQQISLAYVFYRAAYLKWLQGSPPRAAQIKQPLDQLRHRVAARIDDASVEGYWLDWVLGEDIDGRLR